MGEDQQDSWPQVAAKAQHLRQKPTPETLAPVGQDTAPNLGPTNAPRSSVMALKRRANWDVCVSFPGVGSGVFIFRMFCYLKA